MKMKGLDRLQGYLVLLAFNAILLVYYICLNQGGVRLLNDLNPGVVIYFNPFKKQELIHYCVSVLILFVTSGAYLTILRTGYYKKKNGIGVIAASRLRFERRNVIIYLHLLVFPVLVLMAGGDVMTRFIIQLYLLVFGIINLYEIRYVQGNGVYDKVFGGFIVTFIVLAVIGVGYIFNDHLSGRPSIINEYYNIPEYALVDGKYVKTTDYINQNYGNNGFRKWDVDMPVDISGCKQNALGEYGRHQNNVSDSLIYYNEKIRGIYLNKGIKVIVPEIHARNSAKDDEAVSVFYKKGASLSKQSNVKEEKFILENIKEIHWQVLDRYMMHHHGFILNPISELGLGKSLKNIKSQYGLGGITIMRWLMDLTGGVSIESWLRLNALFYLIYYTAYGAVLLVVIGDRLLALLAFLYSMILLNVHGYEFVLLAPGDSPWRNMFDIIILLFIYKCQEKEKNLYLATGLALGVFSVYINPQIGLMMCLSVSAAAVLYELSKKRIEIYKVSFTVLSAFAGVLIYVLFSSKDTLSAYYLQGVIGFPVTGYVMLAIYALLIGAYVIVIRTLRNGFDSEVLAVIYLFLYSQGLLLYYVWHADMSGMLSRSHIYVLTIIMMFRLITKGGTAGHVISANKYIPVLALGFFLYVNTYQRILKEKAGYDNIFQTHKVYNWGFDRAHIRSTINPEYFSESVGIINKYSGGQERICMISKYDDILPFLSHRYNIMPFQNMEWYNVTAKELDESVNVIKNEQPLYVYIDSDIDRNYNDDIISSSAFGVGYLHDESAWRAERLKLMARLYYKISKEYVRVDGTRLISVYRRIT